MVSDYNQYNVPLDISKFTDLVKLRGPEDYEEWHQSISTAFEEQGVWPLVTGLEQPLLSLDPPLAHDTYVNWQRLDKSLAALLGMTVARPILADIPENISIDVMYDFLRTNYEPMPKPQFPQLLKALSRLRLENFPSIRDYSHKFTAIKMDMEALQPTSISQAIFITIYLEGLGRGWEGFKERMIEEFATNEFYTLPFDHVVAEAIDQQDLQSDNDDIGFEPRPTRTRGGRPFCGHCNIRGHLQEDCWRLEGRSEEEIKIIRRTLNQDRARRARNLTRRVKRNRVAKP